MEAYILEYNRSSDFSFSVKEGYYIEKIVMENLTANEATLDIGTTSTSDDIASGMIIPGTGTNEGLTIISFNYPVRDYVVRRKQPPREIPFYVNNAATGSQWNSARIKFTIHLKPLKS